MTCSVAMTGASKKVKLCFNQHSTCMASRLRCTVDALLLTLLILLDGEAGEGGARGAGGGELGEGVLEELEGGGAGGRGELEGGGRWREGGAGGGAGC